MMVFPLGTFKSLASQGTDVIVHCLKTDTDRRDEWRVAKKIKPSQRGARKLTCSYCAGLLCIRHRENTDGAERLTTAELVVERAVIQKRNDPIVSFKIRQEEREQRRLAMLRGARYDGRNYLWRLRRSGVLWMGLRSRITVTAEEPDREQVPP